MFMLDTDICIFVMRKQHSKLTDRVKQHADRICISSITYAELHFGVMHSGQVDHNLQRLQAFRLGLDIRNDREFGRVPELKTKNWLSGN